MSDICHTYTIIYNHIHTYYYYNICIYIYMCIHMIICSLLQVTRLRRECPHETCGRGEPSSLGVHGSLKIMLFLDMAMGQNLSDSIKYHIFLG